MASPPFVFVHEFITGGGWPPGELPPGLADEAGAIRTIGQALPYLTADRGMQALVIGWVFASFLQGVGGFGVPVAVIAPILVGLGFTPLSAVIIPSLGHGWAVTFGSLGSSFQALLAATGEPEPPGQ